MPANIIDHIQPEKRKPPRSHATGIDMTSTGLIRSSHMKQNVNTRRNAGNIDPLSSNEMLLMNNSALGSNNKGKALLVDEGLSVRTIQRYFLKNYVESSSIPRSRQDNISTECNTLTTVNLFNPSKQNVDKDQSRSQEPSRMSRIHNDS